MEDNNQDIPLEQEEVYNKKHSNNEESRVWVSKKQLKLLAAQHNAIRVT